MSMFIAAIVSSVFTVSAALVFAQTTAPASGGKAALTAAEKAEIRDRVERLKTQRTKAEATKAAPATPAAKKAASKG